MFVIGIDPHRGSHVAAMLDRDEQVRAMLHLPADRQQRQRLLNWANGFMPRLWAVEGATGTGALLAQQLVAAGEQVVDVPPKLAARVRLLDNHHSDKTDSHDARSTAIVALRNPRLRQVGLEDHTAVLRLLAKRDHDLIAARTRVICRVHTTVCRAVYGPTGSPGSLSASIRRRRSRLNESCWPATCWRRSAGWIASSPTISCASETPSTRRAPQSPRCTESGRSSPPTCSATAVTSAASRAPGHYARYNATAPIQASSGPGHQTPAQPRGNRQLNHAIHMIAVTQVRYDTPGRAVRL
jgi:transposase